MNVSIRFYSMGKVAKGKIVSELLKVHLEFTSQLSILLGFFFPSEFKIMFLWRNTLLLQKMQLSCNFHFISLPAQLKHKLAPFFSALPSSISHYAP